MDSAANKPLEQILSRRSLIRGSLRQAILWSAVAALMLLLLLLNLNLLLGLWVENGHLDLVIPMEDVPRFERLTGLSISTIAASEAENPGNTEPSSTPVPLSFREHGILPDVWTSRNVWWGAIAAYLYRHVIWLQSNILALIWLLCVGALLFIVRNFSLAWTRDLCQKSAINAVNATRRNLHRQVLRLGPEDLDGSGYELASDLLTTEAELTPESGGQ